MSKLDARLKTLEQRQQLIDKSPIPLEVIFGDPLAEQQIAEAERQAKAQGRPLKVRTIIFVRPKHRDTRWE